MSERASARVYLGSAAFLLGQALSTLAFSLAGVLTAPLPLVWRYRVITLWTRFNLWWLRCTCGLHHVVRGAENIPPRPGVVLCKHESAWETLALQTLFWPQSWLIKRELLWIPFFGWGLALLRPIAIDRADGRDAVRQLIRGGRDRLRRGLWVVVFPEGTRTAPGTSRPFHKGGAVLAKRAGCHVVPVAHNAGDFWQRKSFLKYPGTIELVIGAPIETAGVSATEVNQRAHDWIEDTVRRLRPPTGAHV